MPAQQMTITLDGLDGEVRPKSFGVVVDALFQVLDSVDRRGWRINTSPRLHWRVSAVELVNPLTFTATGEPTYEAHDADGLVAAVVAAIADVEGGRRPDGFLDAELKQFKRIGAELKWARSLVISATDASGTTDVRVTRQLARQSRRMLRAPRVVTREYGSLEGTLIQLVNDPFADDGSARLRERTFGAIVACHSNPKVATELRQYVDRETRVMLYGHVSLEDGLPKRIVVDDYRTFEPDDRLPTLDDVRALGLGPPAGQTIEQMVNGEDDDG